MHHLQKTISTPAPAPTTPDTLQKQVNNTVRRALAGGREKETPSNNIGAQQMTDDGEGEDGSVVITGDTLGPAVRGKM